MIDRGRFPHLNQGKQLQMFQRECEFNCQPPVVQEERLGRKDVGHAANRKDEKAFS